MAGGSVYTRRVTYASAGLGAAAAALGVIRSKGGFAYQLQPEDLLWLGRAVQFEGGDHEATIWTYAQRMVAKPSASLASLVRGHSQPINPRWDEAADAKCQQYPQYCTPSHLARRARAASTPWDGLSAEVRSKVEAWARADLSNPVPRAIDFADPRVSAGFIRRHPGTKIVLQRGNWYLAPPESQSWPSDFVTLRYGDREAGPSLTGSFRAAPVIGIAALAAATGFAGWAWWRYRR